ncbi:unnamed protein product, partial [Closterium sp. Naga37s-1]
MEALSIDDWPKEQQAAQQAAPQPQDEAAEKAKRVCNLGKRLRQIFALIPCSVQTLLLCPLTRPAADEAAEKAKRVRNLGK